MENNIEIENQEISAEIPAVSNTTIIETEVLQTETPPPSVETPTTTIEYNTNTVLIEEKLDTLIAIQNQQMSTSLICIGLISAIIVIYLLYRFISSFIEF